MTVVAATTEPANTAPTVTITRPMADTSVNEGTALTFVVSATDTEDGDLSSKAQWSSSLDGSIGSSAVLSVGTHLITATVIDSGGLVGSSDISVTVVAAPVETTVTLSWLAPKSRDDGTPLALSEIAGYRIYVVAEYSGSDSVIAIDDPAQLSYTTGPLNSDTYHFSISAIDTDGLVSEPSPVVTSTIP